MPNVVASGYVNSLRTWKWPIEIVDLPIKHGGSFQFVYCMFTREYKLLFLHPRPDTIIFDETTSFSGHFESAVDLCLKQTRGKMLNTSAMMSIYAGVVFANQSVMTTLWLFNVAMGNGPFIDGLPIKNGGSFHGELLVITRW